MSTDMKAIFERLAAGHDLTQALLWGDAARCHDTLEELRRQLDVDLPVLDLTGLAEAAALETLEALAPEIS